MIIVMLKTWLYPADPSKYDVINAFKDLKKIDWGIPNNVQKGDIVYLYLGNDIKRIMIKTEVIDDNILIDDLIDDTAYILVDEKNNENIKDKYIRLKMVERFDEDKDNLLDYERLRENGLKGSIRSGIILDNNTSLKKYIVGEEKRIINERRRNLNISHVLSNNDLMHVFKCSNSSGMRRSRRTNTLCIISDHTKSLYDDRWVDDIFHYTGMGQIGPQSLDYAQNKVLYNSNTSDIEVHLFEVFEEGKYIYEGKVELIDEPFQEEQDDIEENSRMVWVFPLRRSENIEPAIFSEEAIEKMAENKEKEASKLDDEKLEKLAKNAKGKSGTRTTKTTTYERDAYVAEFTKRRAKGICQLCEQAAPFKNKKGKAYLETHHIEWLSKGGEDSIVNTVALCPNCHKKMHVLNIEKDIEKLKEKVKLLNNS